MTTVQGQRQVGTLPSHQTKVGQEKKSVGFDGFNWKRTTVSDGNEYAYIDQPPVNDSPSPTVILCIHGFPELAVCWRYQIVDFTQRGYRVIAPDLLGYGDTSKPSGVAAYTKLKSCKALIDILTNEGINGKVVVLAHDWGSVLASRFVQYYPDRVKFWATVCVPPTPAAQPDEEYVDWTVIVENQLKNFGYHLYFMPEENTDEICRYNKTLMLLLYSDMHRGLEPSVEEAAAPFGKRPLVLKDALKNAISDAKDVLEGVQVKDPEIQHYLKKFGGRGMEAPLNWYRTRPTDFQDELAHKLPQKFPKNMPCLFCIATEDQAIPDGYIKYILEQEPFHDGDLECRIIKGADHFVLEEPNHRDQVTKMLGDWIDSEEQKLTQGSKKK